MQTCFIFVKKVYFLFARFGHHPPKNPHIWPLPSENPPKNSGWKSRKSAPERSQSCQQDTLWRVRARAPLQQKIASFVWPKSVKGRRKRWKRGFCVRRSINHGGGKLIVNRPHHGSRIFYSQLSRIFCLFGLKSTKTRILKSLEDVQEIMTNTGLQKNG